MAAIIRCSRRSMRGAWMEALILLLWMVAQFSLSTASFTQHTQAAADAHTDVDADVSLKEPTFPTLSLPPFSPLPSVADLSSLLKSLPPLSELSLPQLPQEGLPPIPTLTIPTPPKPVLPQASLPPLPIDISGFEIPPLPQPISEIPQLPVSLPLPLSGVATLPTIPVTLPPTNLPSLTVPTFGGRRAAKPKN